MSLVEINPPQINLSSESISFFQRVLGPLAEAGDFFSDKIRFYRYKSSLETISRAKDIAKEHGLPVREVPLKTLVPLLEKASLESEGSELIELWATLLATASLDPVAINATYVEILSRLNHEDVKILNSIMEPMNQRFNDAKKIENVPRRMAIIITAVSDTTYDYIRDSVVQITSGKTKEQFRDSLNKFFFDECHKTDRTLQIENIGANFTPYNKDDLFGSPVDKYYDGSLDVLGASGLINRKHYRFSIENAEIYVTLVLPTVLGLQFYRACTGSIINAADGGEVAKES